MSESPSYEYFRELSAEAADRNKAADNAINDYLSKLSSQVAEAKERRLREILAEYVLPFAVILEMPVHTFPLIDGRLPGDLHGDLRPLVRAHFVGSEFLDRDYWVVVREAETWNEVHAALDVLSVAEQ